MPLDDGAPDDRVERFDLTIGEQAAVESMLSVSRCDRSRKRKKGISPPTKNTGYSITDEPTLRR